MNDFLETPMIQYGALGLASFLALALVRAFFLLVAQRHETQRDLFAHHTAREKAFTEQFLACIDRNSAALEKVEQGLARIQVELARKAPPAA